ncbi:MAG: hypothetical protein PHW73_13960 [Atribacterota bacterium]|nr:hypothetical protein [Atribacterota bacterium]
MVIKKRFVEFLIFFILLFVINIPFCNAFKLGTDYPNLPFAQPIGPDSRLPHYILYFFAFGIYVAGALAALSLALGGIQLIMSAESPERVSAAKDRIKSSILGIVILFGAFIILFTINPQLTQLGLTVDIKEPSGPILTGSGKKIAAPYEADITKFGDYNAIEWPSTIRDINGVTYNNCDKSIYAYMIYWYENSDFTKVSSFGELKCGGSFNLGRGGSYKMLEEIPGVYFFATDNCGPVAGSNDSPQLARTTSEDDIQKNWFSANIRSVRLINGSDQTNGPFYGAMLFNKSGYYGSHFWDLRLPRQPDKANCYDRQSLFSEIFGGSASLVNFGSALIYQRANPRQSAGAGVSLYSRREFDEGSGKYCPDQNDDTGSCIISGASIAEYGRSWGGGLGDMRITYPENTDVPQEEQQKCQTFLSQQKVDCFQSMKIDGRFIVLLSTEQSSAENNGKFVSRNYGQAFPTPAVQDGPPDLNRTYIKTNYAEYIEIIPLAKSPFE